MPEHFDNIDNANSRKDYLRKLKNGEYSSSEKREFLKSAVIFGYSSIVDKLLKDGVKPGYLKWTIVYPHMKPADQIRRKRVADVFRKHGVKLPQASKTASSRSSAFKRRASAAKRRSSAIKRRSSAVKRRSSAVKRRSSAVKRRASAVKRRASAVKRRSSAVKRRSSAVKRKQSSAKMECRRKKISRTMGEFKRRSLKLRNGKPVTNRRQAIAIALSQADRYC
ncbi:hypothetical protein EBS40_06265 [bacterium]|nr:hypothetical protein [bacterium]